MKNEVRQKKYALKKYRRQMAKINRLENKLRELDFTLEGMKSKEITDMPRGGQPVDMDDLLSRKEELEIRINNLVQKSRVTRTVLYNWLDNLDDERCSEILEMYFIDLLSFEDIADIKHYSARHVNRLYSKGLNEIVVSSIS